MWGNSKKNLKSHVFWILKKNVKNVKKRKKRTGRPNHETIYSAGSGDWTQARLITVSGSAQCANESAVFGLGRFSHGYGPFWTWVGRLRTSVWAVLDVSKICEPFWPGRFWFLAVLVRGTYEVLLVEVDEWERKGDVKSARLVRVGGTFAWLEGDHQIDPTGRALRLERLDELAAEYLTQQLLKLSVDSCTHRTNSCYSLIPDMFVRIVPRIFLSQRVTISRRFFL